MDLRRLKERAILDSEDLLKGIYNINSSDLALQSVSREYIEDFAVFVVTFSFGDMDDEEYKLYHVETTYRPWKGLIYRISDFKIMERTFILM